MRREVRSIAVDGEFQNVEGTYVVEANNLCAIVRHLDSYQQRTRVVRGINKGRGCRLRFNPQPKAHL
jgi:hypothetical protein